MRTSFIALLALVASPLLVFAAPSSQLGSLAVRDLGPLDLDFLDNLDTLSPDNIFEHIEGLADDDVTEFVSNLTEEKLDIIKDKVGDGKFEKILKKLKLDA